MTSHSADRDLRSTREAWWPSLRIRLRVLARSWVRNDDLGLVLTAIALGGIVGLGIVLIRRIDTAFHLTGFGISLEEQMSGAGAIDWWRILAVPAVGGLIYGGVALLMRRWRPHDIVDAIEANALYGGRMSLADSLRLTGLTLLSGGVGASVGLEAAYTQLGAGLASWLGQQLRLRRVDLRTLVGCGAAAAIAAAFNAPLAGAFYAFELVIGSYTLATLAPVAGAALSGALVQRVLVDSTPIFIVDRPAVLHATDYLLLAGLGLTAAGLAILAMIGVTMVEAWFKRLALPAWLRPATAGLMLASIALVYPDVLGSGHGGIVSALATAYTLPVLLGLITAKLVGSAVSIGGGFRGGMFSSSLFLGALFGAAFASLAALVLPAPPDKILFALAGMGAVAAGIVGAPITIVLLVLEATSDFSATIGVTAAVIVASFTVRQSFGYSFATWRFHVRGVPLQSAHDVGRLQDLTVARVMRRDPPLASQDLAIDELRALYPIGTRKTVFLTDAEGRYAGMIDVPELHDTTPRPAGESAQAAELVPEKTYFLLPHQPLRVALDLFVAADTETLPVLDDATSRRVVGYLTEAYALRRYSRELEERRRDELGESEVFSPNPPGGP